MKVVIIQLRRCRAFEYVHDLLGMIGVAFDDEVNVIGHDGAGVDCVAAVLCLLSEPGSDGLCLFAGKALALVVFAVSQ